MKQVVKADLMNPAVLTPRILMFRWTKNDEPSPLDLRVYLHGSVQDRFITVSLPQQFPDTKNKCR